MSLFVKDSQAVLDFAQDWSAWLAASETITTSTWAVPSGITKDSESNTATKATVWLSGGAPGSSYKVVNTITTNQGRTDRRTIVIEVEER